MDNVDGVSPAWRSLVLAAVSVSGDALVDFAIAILIDAVADLWCIGMVGRKPYLGWVMNLVDRVNPIADLALVANCVIEDGEERLAVRPVFPVRLASALVPDWADFFKVVMKLIFTFLLLSQLSLIIFASVLLKK